MTWNDPDQFIQMAHKPSSIPVGEWSSHVTTWYQSDARVYPWRELWFQNQCPYPVWVSEVMLQQTQIKTVLPIYKKFIRTFPAVNDLASATEDALRTATAGLGYYRRFKYLHLGAQWVVEQRKRKQGWEWPGSRAEWLEVPGVGPYTSAAIASITLNELCAVVDGNVERVISRIFDVRLPPNLPKIKKAFEKIAQNLIETPSAGDYNQGVMEIGQRFCTPSRPDCESCPVSRFCNAKAYGSTHLAPQPKIKKASVERKLIAHLGVAENGLIGVVERTKGGSPFLSGTKGFFLSDQVKVDGAVYCGTVSHLITHYRLEVEVWSYKVDHSSMQQHYDDGVIWIEPGQLASSLHTSLDKKVWKTASSSLFSVL